MIGVKYTCEKMRSMPMVYFNVKKFLRCYSLMKRCVGSVAEEAFRSDEGVGYLVWSVSEAPSHLNFTEKSCGLEIDLVE